MTNQHTESEHWLTAEEAADRLGVKRQTLYAYVSRGLLAREREPGRRTSRFAAADVEALVTRGRGTARSDPRYPPSPMGPGAPSLDTAITAIEGGSLYYRGRDAVGLAERYSFERVSEWMWGADPSVFTAASEAPWRSRWVASPAISLGRELQRCLAPETPRPDRIRLIIAALGPSDPYRYDLRPEQVRMSGAGLIASLIDALPELSTPVVEAHLASGESIHIASQLWSRLSPTAPSPSLLEALNTALVVLADHELATSTFTVRVATSVRADPYAAVSAGLGAVSGSLHGGVGPLVMQLLARARRPAEVIPTVAEHLKRQSTIPGLGHPLYPEGDPRARAVLLALRQAKLGRTARVRLDTVERLLEVVRERTSVAPNIDFAIAALGHVGGMAPDAAETLFSIARCAGWIAHAIEEYAADPLRFRIRARYVGPAVQTSSSTPPREADAPP